MTGTWKWKLTLTAVAGCIATWAVIRSSWRTPVQAVCSQTAVTSVPRAMPASVRETDVPSPSTQSKRRLPAPPSPTPPTGVALVLPSPPAPETAANAIASQPAVPSEPVQSSAEAPAGADLAWIRQVLGQMRNGQAPALSFDDRSRLRVWLTARVVASGREGEEIHVLKNDVMKLLGRQPAPDPDLAATLVAIFRDRAQDPVIRDYAIQHLGAGYAAVPDATRQDVRDALWEAAAETESHIGGTALIALESARAADRSVETADLSRRLVTTLADPRASPAARIAALGVSAMVPAPTALPSIRSLLSQPQEEPLLLAALHALGKLGDGAEDRALLARYASGGSGRLQRGAQKALGWFESRQGKTNSRGTKSS
jgi:hypothetical protein